MLKKSEHVGQTNRTASVYVSKAEYLRSLQWSSLSSSPNWTAWAETNKRDINSLDTKEKKLAKEEKNNE